MQHRKNKGTKREVNTKENFQEVGPHVSFPPKFYGFMHLMRILENFIGYNPLFHRDA
jgi:hypothetical protein